MQTRRCKRKVEDLRKHNDIAIESKLGARVHSTSLFVLRRPTYLALFLQSQSARVSWRHSMPPSWSSPLAQETNGGLRPFLIHTAALTVDAKSTEKVLEKSALVLFFCSVDEKPNHDDDEFEGV